MERNSNALAGAANTSLPYEALVAVAELDIQLAAMLSPAGIVAPLAPLETWHPDVSVLLPKPAEGIDP